MAKFAHVTLLFFLATFIGHVLTLPLLRRDDNQLEQDLELFNGDLDSLSEDIDAYSRVSPDIPQSNQLPSAFDTSNSDLQKCIDDINSITTIQTADASIVLKLVKDFTPTITGMLKNLQNKVDIFEELGMIPFILSRVKTLNSGVSTLVGALEKVIPVCHSPYKVKVCAADY
ncbi:hypothetical protein F5887DRAFT_597519 [Amanita rubescens]|nr:hypothetical protein F5887DRAFT_597519 [Amanita rubescens]